MSFCFFALTLEAPALEDSATANIATDDGSVAISTKDIGRRLLDFDSAAPYVDVRFR